MASGKSIQSAAITVATLGDNTIVNAVTGRKIKVIAYTMQGTGTVNVKWKNGVSTDFSGAFNLQAREGISASINSPDFLFATVKGSALILNLSTATTVVGHVTYFDDDDY